MAKNSLGKGLDALLRESEASEFFHPIQGHPVPAGLEQAGGGAFSVGLDLLKPNPQQPRSDFDPEALEELAASIRENGVIQPVIIEDAGEGSFYIIAGERRVRAARIAGLQKIPAVLKQFSEANKLEIALIENIQRENLNPLEEAQGYQHLTRLKDITQEAVADLVGKKRSTVANALRLLKLPEDMQSALASGKISAGHARALLAMTNPTEQRALFGRILGSDMSVREAEQYVLASKNRQDSVPPRAPMPRDPDFAHLEQRFIEALGTKVSLKGSFDRGSLSIDFFSKDDLDRLYTLIVGE